jgi:hypothetical protein
MNVFCVFKKSLDYTADSMLCIFSSEQLAENLILKQINPENYYSEEYTLDGGWL